ncbi:unnamed protein product, partial [Meganyctiphanes norvegica]
QLPVVEWFMKQTGAHLNIQASKGNTALMFAVEEGLLDFVEVLINSQTKCSVDMDMKNDVDETAAEIAERNDHPEIVTMLSEGRQRMVMTERWLRAAADEDLDTLVKIREESFEEVETEALEKTKELAEDTEDMVTKHILGGAYYIRQNQLRNEKKQQFNDLWIEATNEGDSATLAKLMEENFDLLDTEVLEMSVQVAEEHKDTLTK